MRNEEDMMKIKIQDNGTITFGGDVPLSPTQAQADDVMRELSRVLGENYGAVKLSGYWVLGRYDWSAIETGGTARWEPFYGNRAGQRTKNFDKLLTNGLNRAVVRMVEI